MSNHNYIKPCKNNVGAFADIDLNKINETAIEQIKTAINNYGVIFFRNQNLTSTNYIKFAKYFG